MASKTYTSSVYNRTARPRSERLRKLGVAASSVTVSSGSSSSGGGSVIEGHTHSNLEDLEKLSVSGQTLLINEQGATVANATHADNADNATNANFATNAEHADSADVADALSDAGIDSLRDTFLEKDKDTSTEYTITAGGLKSTGDVSGKNVTATEKVSTKDLSATGSSELNEVTSTDITNSNLITTKNLKVTGKAEFFELVIEKIKSVGGSAMFTPADGFTIDAYEQDGSDYYLYWKADNGDTAIQNMWKAGDQALCMNFNQATVGTNTQIKNTYWWALVKDIEYQPVSSYMIGGGLIGTADDRYHYILVSGKYGDVDGKLIPVIGDSVVMCGHRQQTDEDSDKAKQRGNAIYIAAYDSLDTGYTVEGVTKKRGLVAPFYAQYRGICSFELSRYRKSFMDAEGSEFYGDFKIGTDEEGIDDYINNKTTKTATYTYYHVASSNDAPTYPSKSDYSTLSDYQSALTDTYGWSTSSLTPTDDAPYMFKLVINVYKNGTWEVVKPDLVAIKDTSKEGVSYITVLGGAGAEIEGVWNETYPSIVVNGTEVAIPWIDKKTEGDHVGHFLCAVNPTTYEVVATKFCLCWAEDSTEEERTWIAAQGNAIIIMASKNSCTIDSALRTFLQSYGGRADAGTWSRQARAHVFIGQKGLAEEQAFEAYSSVAQSGTSHDEMTVTAQYLGAWNGAKGSDGKTTTEYDGVEILVNPTALAFTTDDDGKVKDNSKTATITAYRGGDEVTISDVTKEGCTQTNCNTTIVSNDGKVITLTIAVDEDQSSTITGTNVKIPPTSGSAQVKVICEGKDYIISVPFSVSVNKSLYSIVATNTEYKSEYDQFKTDTNNTLKEYQSQITQNASAISLKVDAKDIVFDNLLPDPLLTKGFFKSPLLYDVQGSTTENDQAYIGETSIWGSYSQLSEYDNRLYGIYVNRPSSEQVNVYFSGFTGVEQRVLLKADTDYTFSVWVKSNNIDKVFCVAQYNLWENNTDEGASRNLWSLGTSNKGETIDGYTQYYVSFNTATTIATSNGKQTAGSAMNNTALYFSWMPYYGVQALDDILIWAAAKLEEGTIPTTIFPSTQKKLLSTGIDIENKQITLTTDNLTCKNNAGEKTMWLDSRGNLTTSGIQLNLAHTITDDSSLLILNESTYDLDVMSIGDLIYIESASKNIKLPYYINSKMNYRSYTNYGGTKHLIKPDELRRLVGKRLTVIVTEDCDAKYLLGAFSFSMYQNTNQSGDGANLQGYLDSINLLQNGMSWMKVPNDASVGVDLTAGTVAHLEFRIVRIGPSPGYPAYAWTMASTSETSNIDDEWTDSEDEEEEEEG